MDNLKQFLAICFFKHQSSELAENSSLSSALLFYTLVAVAIQINFLGSIGAFIGTGLEILLTLGFIGWLTFSHKILEEFIPFSCAVLVCSGFIASLSIPFILMLYIIKGKLSLFIYYTLVGLIIWNISVIHYLFAKVLQIVSIRSFFLAIGYFFTVYAGNFLAMLIVGVV
jgi:hypothetical protein